MSPVLLCHVAHPTFFPQVHWNTCFLLIFQVTLALLLRLSLNTTKNIFLGKSNLLFILYFRYMSLYSWAPCPSALYSLLLMSGKVVYSSSYSHHSLCFLPKWICFSLWRILLISFPSLNTVVACMGSSGLPILILKCKSQKTDKICHKWFVSLCLGSVPGTE